jgi:hypothetical protein
MRRVSDDMIIPSYTMRRVRDGRYVRLTRKQMIDEITVRLIGITILITAGTGFLHSVK